VTDSCEYGNEPLGSIKGNEFLFYRSELGFSSSSSSVSLFLVPFSGIGIFYLWIPYTFGRTPWAGDQSSAKASNYTGQYNTQKHRHTSMPRAGFEPAIPMFERPKTVLVLDSAANETGELGSEEEEEEEELCSMSEIVS
jgi:hypothetical protein